MTRATAPVPRGRTPVAVLLSVGTVNVATLAPPGGFTPESHADVPALVTDAGATWEERTVPKGSPEIAGLADSHRPAPLWDLQVGLLGATRCPEGAVLQPRRPIAPAVISVVGRPFCSQVWQYLGVTHLTDLTDVADL